MPVRQIGLGRRRRPPSIRCEGNGPNVLGAGRAWPVDRVPPRAPPSGCRRRRRPRRRSRSGRPAASGRPRSRSWPAGRCDRGHRPRPRSADRRSAARAGRAGSWCPPGVTSAPNPMYARYISISPTAYSSRTTGYSPGSIALGAAAPDRLVDRLPAERLGVDGVDVAGGPLGVAGALVVQHHGQQAGAAMRSSWRRTPRELAMPTSVVSVEQAPDALRPASTASAQIGPTIRARCSGVQSAVAWLKLCDGLGGQRRRAGPAAPGLRAGAAPPRRPAPRPAPAPASDRSLVVATPERLPTIARTRTSTLRSATFWWMPELANRVSAESAPIDDDLRLVGAWTPPAPGRQASRIARARVARPSARAYRITPIWTSRTRIGGRAVPDVHRLGRLALAAVRRAPDRPLAADRVAGAPEARRDAGVGGVLQHRAELAVPDLPADLGAELEVQADVVDAPAPVGLEEDAPVGVGDQVVKRPRRPAPG